LSTKVDTRAKPEAARPRIVSLRAPSQVERGGKFEISWTIAGACTGLTLNGQAVSGSSCVVEADADPTPFTLVATSSAGSDTASVYVGTHDTDDCVSIHFMLHVREVLSNPRWAAGEMDHGSHSQLLVDAPRLEGRTVRFLVEHEDAGKWKPFTAVTAVVKGGVASASVKGHHPIVSPSRPKPASSKEIKQARPAKLRFHAELLPEAG
jgi:hypothetical protein